MKGSALAYGGVLLMLVMLSLFIAYITSVSDVRRDVVTIEGKLLSFANYVHLLLKTFDQSVEFISQRAAYDLGKTGGLEREVYWDSFYPKIDVLERSLEKVIKNRLPSENIKDSKTITFGEGSVDVIKYDEFPCGPIESSKCFFVNGTKDIIIYDKSIETRVSLNPHKFYSQINSNYFKLLNAGRAIMEDPQFNQYLNDVGALLNELYNAKAAGDPRFQGLDFSATVSGDVVEMTIVENCYPPETYCLAPLKPEETGIIDPTTGEEIPYDYFKLKFKFQAEQTGNTPINFDFDIQVNPETDSIKSGESTQAFVKVNLLGAETKVVSLSYSISPPEPTISVSFTPASGEPTYTSLMTITTTDMTMAGDYTITVIGSGNGITRTATFTLTVNPSMFFILTLNPDNDKIDIGSSTTSTVNINLASGTPSSVVLNALNVPNHVSVSFSPNSCTPTCTSTMSITTDNSIEPGIYTFKVSGKGGGSREEATYTLTIAKPFDFDLELSQYEETIAATQSISLTVTLTLKDPDMISKTVFLSYSMSPDEPTISVSFTPASGEPDFTSDILITTQETTPDGDYIIVITASGGGVSHSKTFVLHVITPECYDDSDCDDGNPCTGVETEGGIDKCRFPGTADAYCDRPNLPAGYVPPGNACGTVTISCSDKCSGGREYREPTTPTATCSIACDGMGNCGSSCTPTCSYNSIKTCRYGCKDNVNCWAGLWCEETRARCRISQLGWCYGDCEPPAGSDECDFCAFDSLECGRLCVAGNRCYSEDGGPEPIPDVLCDVTCSWGFWTGISKAVKDCSICEAGWDNKEGGCSPFIHEDDTWDMVCLNDEGSIISGCWKVPCYQTEGCTYV